MLFSDRKISFNVPFCLRTSGAPWITGLQSSECRRFTGFKNRHETLQTTRADLKTDITRYVDHQELGDLLKCWTFHSWCHGFQRKAEETLRFLYFERDPELHRRAPLRHRFGAPAQQTKSLRYFSEQSCHPPLLQHQCCLSCLPRQSTCTATSISSELLSAQFTCSLKTLVQRAVPSNTTSSEIAVFLIQFRAMCMDLILFEYPLNFACRRLFYSFWIAFAKTIYQRLYQKTRRWVGVGAWQFQRWCGVLLLKSTNCHFVPYTGKK